MQQTALPLGIQTTDLVLRLPEFCENIFCGFNLLVCGTLEGGGAALGSQCDSLLMCAPQSLDLRQASLSANLCLSGASKLIEEEETRRAQVWRGRSSL